MIGHGDPVLPVSVDTGVAASHTRRRRNFVGSDALVVVDRAVAADSGCADAHADALHDAAISVVVVRLVATLQEFPSVPVAHRALRLVLK